jgi:hypothetical protein
MNLAPLFLVAGLCLAFTLLLFFVREQVTLRSVAAARRPGVDDRGGRAER